MKLLGSNGSPFVRKVRVVAAEKGIALDYVIDRPGAAGSRVPEFNPLGKIPVLLPEAGEPVYDSAVIVEYLDGLGSGPRLIPEAFAGRIAVRRWEALGDGLAEVAVLLSHDYGPMNDPEKRAAWGPRQQAKIVRSLDALERAVAGGGWLHGGAFSLADVGVGYALFYLDQVLPETAWRDGRAALAAYAARLADRSSFASTVPPAA